MKQSAGTNKQAHSHLFWGEGGGMRHVSQSATVSIVWKSILLFTLLLVTAVFSIAQQSDTTLQRRPSSRASAFQSQDSTVNRLRSLNQSIRQRQDSIARTQQAQRKETFANNQGVSPAAQNSPLVNQVQNPNALTSRDTNAASIPQRSTTSPFSDNSSGGAPLVMEELPKGAKDSTDLSFKDADLRDIFRALSFQHNLNVFLDNSINKRTTISLRSVRVYDALRFLCEQNGLMVRLEGGIFQITPPPPAAMPPPPPPRIPLIGFENGLLSVQLKDDDLEKVVLEIQKKAGKNILIISGTTGTVTGKLMDIEFDLGFSQLMNNNGFAVQKKNGIYVVSRAEYFVGTQGTSSPQKTGPYWVTVKDSLVSIDVTGAPLERVLTDMIRQLNTDLVLYNAVTGTITARATNIPLFKALDMILRNTNFTFRESEGVYFIGEKTNKALVSTQLVKLKYLQADQTVDMLPLSITSQATIKPMKEQNGFVITAANDIHEQFREFVNKIDKPIPQVLIEAIVVDYDVSKGSEFGIEAGLFGPQDTTHFSRKGGLYPGVDMKFGGRSVNNMLKQAGKFKIFGTDIDLGKLASLPDDFYLNLKAMESDGTANVRSRPILATLNGHKATLSIGTTQYYLLKTTTPYRDQNQTVFQETQTFQTIQADVKLEITPYVGSDGLITVDVKPDFRTPVGQLSSNTPPTINSRSLSSTIVMREGETIVLGGLVEESESELETKVPILGSIPLLGKLFTSSTKTKRKTELLIYLTPHISYGEAFKQAYQYKNDD